MICNNQGDIMDIQVQLDNPMAMLETWRRSSDEKKIAIVQAYIKHWRENETLYIHDIFDGVHKRRSKENQWHYWWKTINILGPEHRDVWLDKWFNTLNEARARRQISIEIELLDNTNYWQWPVDRDNFFVALATRLVDDVKNTRVFNTDMTPFRFNTDFPGVGQAKMRWREYVMNLITKVHPSPESIIAQSLHAKLWLVTGAFVFRQENTNLDAAPDIPFFNKVPRVWFDIVANDLTLQDSFKRIDLSAVMN